MEHFYRLLFHFGRSGAMRHASLDRRRSPDLRQYIHAGVLALILLLGAQPALPARLEHELDSWRSVELPTREAFPSYIGLDNIHVSYTYQSECGDACLRELRVAMAGGTVVLATLPSGTVVDSYYHEGLAPGRYYYSIVETRIADEVVVYQTQPRPGDVDGETLSGTTLYDETLIGDRFACDSLEGVTVGNGLDFNLEGTQMVSSCRIVLGDNAMLTAQGSQFEAVTLSIGGTGVADINGNTFDANVLLDVGSGVDANISFSRFLGTLNLAGSANDLQFQGNHFGGKVVLQTRSGVSFKDNVFVSTLSLENFTSGADSWCQDNGLSPTLQGNSFVGSWALSHTLIGCAVTDVTPIDVGWNYYGDPQGPVYGAIEGDPLLPNIDYGIKWLQRGAVVVPNLFRIYGYEVTGTQWTDNQVFPSFWLNGYRLGQHTLTNEIPTLLRGKESLFTVDLVTSHERVDGAKVWVEWNGQKVETSDPSPLTLVRDPERKASLLRSAASTIDFFLPPTEGVTATLELWLDTTAVTGFDDADGARELKKLLDLTVPLKAPPPLIGIHIVPVTVDSVRPSISQVQSTLKSVTPAMLPVVPENLRISSTGYSPAWRSTDVPIWVLVNAVATDLVGYRSAMRYDPVEFPKGELMDFVVGVMPAGSMGGGDGVYLNLRARIVLVDENKPEAVFHELGHAIGLYPLTEQYSWFDYPPNGLPVEGVTLFLNQATVSNATVNGVFVGDPGRVLHTPSEGQWWHDPFLVVVDVMGNTAPFWPHPSTLRSFETAFYHLATEPRPSAVSLLADLDERRVVVTVETERVEVTEVSLYQGEQRCASYRPLIDTARLYPRDAFTGLTSGTSEDPEVITGALPLCLTADALSYAPGDIELCLMPWDESGDIMPEYYTCQRVLAPDEVNTARQRDMAILFYEVPVSAVRYSLVTSRSQALPRLLTSSAALAVNLLEPSEGAILTDTVTLRWESEATLRDPEVPAGQPLLHQVAYSNDGGATWSPVGLPVEGDTMVLSTDFLPSGGPLAFSVTVSDGFLTDDDQVSGLQVPQKLPEAVIHSPSDGDRAETGYAWQLQGWGWDNESKTSVPGTWYSSLDGNLGSGPTLSGVVLSPGTHILTYMVIDGLGSQVEATVTVTVEAMPTVDLALVPDALSLTMPWRDPVTVGSPRLQTGITQTVTLALRNTGRSVTTTLQLFVQPPGAVEQLIVEETLSLAPFETYFIGGDFTATSTGTHQFRGVVTAISPLDNNPTNNVRQWELPAVGPPQLVPNADTVEFTAPAGTPVDKVITLRNTGGLGLIVRHVALEQDAALTTGFRLWGDNCSGTPLLSNATCQVTVRYTPSEGIEEQVRLEISSTDPEAPAQAVVLDGKVGELVGEMVYVYLPQMLRTAP